MVDNPIRHLAADALDEAIKSIAGFYPTPNTVIDMMLQYLGPIGKNERVLEPSAGCGAIVDRLAPSVVQLVVIEPHPLLAELLTCKGYTPIEQRFEEYEPDGHFHKVVMNPPFADGRDMLHVRRAFEMLAPGGVLVALMNNGEGEGDGTPEQRRAFRAWLEDEAAIESVHIEPLDPELFRSPENFRPSHIPIRLVCIHKVGPKHS
jgi:hypothetical protein